MSSKVPLFRTFKRNGSSGKRLLFLFPWAGGNISCYDELFSSLKGHAEVWRFCLPRKENNRYHCLTQAVHDAAKELRTKLSDKEFIVFGHSFGAMFSFLVLEHCKKEFGIEPLHAFFSGTPAPNSSERIELFKTIDTLATDEDFRDYLDKQGGVTDTIRQSEFYNDFVENFKADLRLSQQCRVWQNKEDYPPLTCPLTFFYGKDDVNPDLEAWRKLTSGAFDDQKMDGGHFFLLETTNSACIREHLKTALMSNEQSS